MVYSVWNHLSFYKLVLAREANFLVFKKLGYKSVCLEHLNCYKPVFKKPCASK
jgi:hypothetical protein